MTSRSASSAPQGPAVPLRLEGGPPVIIQQPRPLLVTDRSCEASAGLTMRAWRKVARAMQIAGYRVTDTSDGVTASLSDLEEWVRNRAPAHEERVRAKNVEPENDDDAEYRRATGRAA